MITLPNKRIVYVFDNKGRTPDRFTIVLDDSSVYGCCMKPFDVNGKAIHSHTKTDDYKCRGIKITKDIVKKCIEEDLKRYRLPSNKAWFGDEIYDFKSLPDDVQRYILKINE